MIIVDMRGAPGRYCHTAGRTQPYVPTIGPGEKGQLGAGSFWNGQVSLERGQQNRGGLPSPNPFLLSFCPTGQKAQTLFPTTTRAPAAPVLLDPGYLVWYARASYNSIGMDEHPEWVGGADRNPQPGKLGRGGVHGGKEDVWNVRACDESRR